MNRKFGFLKNKHIKPRGQSLVELAIVLAVLMFMLVGIAEYGFLLNGYLNLVDATREAARFGANVDPFYLDEFDVQQLDMNFFVRPDTSMPPNNDPADPDYNPSGLADYVEHFLQPLVLDADLGDDIVISFFSVNGAGDIVRFPISMPLGYSYFDNKDSLFSDGEITARIAEASGAPPTGVLLIEVFYNYPQTLNLPVFSNIIPNPIPVHAYAIMPLSAAEPTPLP